MGFPSVPFVEMVGLLRFFASSERLRALRELAPQERIERMGRVSRSDRSRQRRRERMKHCKRTSLASRMRMPGSARTIALPVG